MLNQEVKMTEDMLLTRRQALAGAFGATLAGTRISFAKASQPATPVKFDVPANSCDCHTHIFGDPKRFPFWPGRTYTPETAMPDEMAALHRALHIQRVVIVTPSVYGTDNSATLFGVKARGQNARGVAVIAENTPESLLDALAQAGIRGIRLNFTTVGETDPAVARRRFQALSKQLPRLGWHLQINTGLNVISGIKDLVGDAPMPVVFDHFGGLKAAAGLAQPGFADLVELVHSGHAYVKISAPYRASTQPPDYADVVLFAKALIAANADRILWGSDWPHPNTVITNRPTDVSPLLSIDDGRVLNQLAVWAPDPALRKRILVDNPARLYSF
jgi:predicted TIM-barrel fold metal-dependent hydrolase